MMQYKKVFFLVRHCLRSTPSEVDLCDGQGVRYPLTYESPEWNTPEYFCTAVGLQHISALGEFLADTTNDEYELSFERIVSDSVYRDADTSMALAVALGISSVDYQREVFRPEMLCPLTNDYTLETAARVEKRFHEIPMPANLAETLTELHTILEGDDDTNSTTIHNSTKWLFTDANARVTMVPETNQTCISGSINAIKLFAQQLFYSRASGIPFHTQEFNDPTYYTPWIAYMRHLLDTYTVAAAVRGAILIQHMLHSKASTIYVGHDTDINALSTILELNYTLPEYGMTATPPGSGILVGVTRGGAVEVKYLYPTFQYDASNAANVSMKMQWQALREFRSVPDLSRRIRIQLGEDYGEEVLQCFDRLETHWTGSNFWWHSAPSIVFGLTLVIACSCVVYHRRQRRRRTIDIGKRSKGSDEYGVVLPEMM